VRLALGFLLATLVLGACGCGSSGKPAPPPKVVQFQLNSKLMGRPLYETLVTPAGGGKGRPLLVFLHGYGAAPSDVVTPPSSRHCDAWATARRSWSFPKATPAGGTTAGTGRGAPTSCTR